MLRRLRIALLCGSLAVAPAAAQVQPFQYQNITTKTTTTVKSAPGTLHAITFNNPVATGTVTIYDNTAGSGTTIGTITVPSSPQPVTVTYDVQFWTGLTIVTATENMDITVSFR